MDTKVSSTPRAFLSIDVIPEWVYNGLLKSQFNPGYQLKDLARSKRLSIEDLAAMIYLNCTCQDNNLKNNLYLSKDSSLLGFNSSLSPGSEVLEGGGPFFNLVDPADQVASSRYNTAMDWAWSDSVRKNLLMNLGGNPNTLYNEAGPPYMFHVTGSKIWLILKPGFVSLLENPTQRILFYRDYVSTAEQVAPFTEVAATDVFAHWVCELMR